MSNLELWVWKPSDDRDASPLTPDNVTLPRAEVVYNLKNLLGSQDQLENWGLGNLCLSSSCAPIKAFPRWGLLIAKKQFDQLLLGIHNYKALKRTLPSLKSYDSIKWWELLHHLREDKGQALSTTSFLLGYYCSPRYELCSHSKPKYETCSFD